MSGTIGYAFKRAFIDTLKELPGLNGVQVAYTFPGSDMQRECIFGGKIQGTSEPAAFQSSALQPREENFVFALHCYVAEPGHEDCSATEARVVELGAAVEEFIAGNPRFADDLPGLRALWIAEYELDSGIEDETTMSGLDYQIAVKAYLT